MAKAYQIKQINQETGELQDPLLRLDEYYRRGDTVLMVEVPDGEVDAPRDKYKIFPKRHEEEEVKDFSHIPAELGDKMLDLSSGKMFSKVFHLKDPNFTKTTYDGYWFHICRNLSRDTNIILNRSPKLHFVESIRELAEICKCSEAAVYRFAKECREKGLIATFELKKQKVFIANPHYTLNGRYFPVALAKLFDEVSKGKPTILGINVGGAGGEEE